MSRQNIQLDPNTCFVPGCGKPAAGCAQDRQGCKLPLCKECAAHLRSAQDLHDAAHTSAKVLAIDGPQGQRKYAHLDNVDGLKLAVKKYSYKAIVENDQLVRIDVQPEREEPKGAHAETAESVALASWPLAAPRSRSTNFTGPTS